MIGAIVAWHSHRTTQQFDSEIAALVQRRAALAKTALRLEGEIAASQSQRAELEATIDQSRARPRSVANVAGPASARAAGSPRSNPELHARALETLKTGLPQKYAAFYRALGLTPAQTAKFEALLIEHEGRRRDIMAAETAVRIDSATAKTREAITLDGRRVQVLVDPAIATLRRDEDMRFKTELTSLLGESGNARLEAFDQTAESRGVVTELVRNLSLGSAPLSVEQGTQLFAILQDVNYRAKIAPEHNRWDEILQRTRPLLAPTQAEEFEALITRLRRDAARNPLHRAVQEGRKASRSSGGP
ncbi:MAG: hypothetical protein Q7S40_04655 [Opitutaceae bacterium]|nr:hypothetical protein [Opitutaceae bacterium]